MKNRKKIKIQKYLYFMLNFVTCYLKDLYLCH